MFKNFIYQHEGTLVQDSINTINVNSCLLFSLNINTGGSRISQTVLGGVANPTEAPNYTKIGPRGGAPWNYQ